MNDAAHEELLANRLHRVTKDMAETVSYLDAYSALIAIPKEKQLGCHNDLLLATYNAAIVSYSRGFLKSNSVGNALKKLAVEDLSIFLQLWARELHHTIIGKRDTMIAHADWEHHSTQLDKEGSPPGGAIRSSSIPQIFAGIQHHQFRELAASVLSEARNRHFDIDRRLCLAVDDATVLRSAGPESPPLT